MEPLPFDKYIHPCYPTSIALAHVVISAQFDDEATVVVQTVHFFTGFYFPIFASTKVVPHFAASCSTAMIAGLSMFASDAACSDVATVTAFALVKPITSSSALRLFSPILPSFSSSLLASSAFVPHSLNTPDYLVDFGVGIQSFFICLSRRDFEYADLVDFFLAKEISIERLKSDVQSLNE